jgi:hypothetical protein
MAETISFSDVKLEGGWLMVKPVRWDLGKAMGIVRKHKDKLYDLTVKEHQKKRSLDANAYAWVLINKIADVLRITPIEIYRQAIQNVSGNYEVIPVKEEAAAHFKQIWEAQGLGWPCVDMGKSRIEGYRNLRAYYGSSTFSVQQMQVLIDNLVQDCRALDIEVKSDEEIASLMGAWK